MKKTSQTILLYWLPVVVLCLAIFVQSCFPSADTGPDFPLKDKVLHVAVYSLLAVLFGRACRRTWNGRLTRLQLLTICVFFVTLYGLSDEWHQHYVATRKADVMDGLADFAGSVLGAAVYIRWRQPNASSRPSKTER